MPLQEAAILITAHVYAKKGASHGMVGWRGNHWSSAEHTPACTDDTIQAPRYADDTLVLP